MGMIDDLDVAARLHRLPVWRNADRETRQGLLRSETHQANIDAVRGMPATYETKADFIGCSVRQLKPYLMFHAIAYTKSAKPQNIKRFRFLMLSTHLGCQQTFNI